jgi:hypothetical protein
MMLGPCSRQLEIFAVVRRRAGEYLMYADAADTAAAAAAI